MHNNKTHNITHSPRWCRRYLQPTSSYPLSSSILIVRVCTCMQSNGEHTCSLAKVVNIFATLGDAETRSQYRCPAIEHSGYCSLRPIIAYPPNPPPHPHGPLSSHSRTGSSHNTGCLEPLRLQRFTRNKAVHQLHDNTPCQSHAHSPRQRQ